MSDQSNASSGLDMQELSDAFAFLETWEERFELITDLGRELEPLPDSERTDANLVAGCTTRTWLTGSRAPDSDALELRADAETPLVRGLVALLLMPFRGKSPQEVLEADPRPFIEQLRLEEALSAKRRAGMEAFLERVKHIARQHRGD
jgi:cysteine desulfuration protein SufE